MHKEKKSKLKDESAEVLKSFLIIELARAGVPQSDIRRIVGCEMRLVSDIARFFKNRKKV